MKEISSAPPARRMNAGAMPHLPISISCCNSTDFEENKFMVDRDKIQFDLIKLAGGGRILRLTEPQSGLALEKKIAPAGAVARQKERHLRAFEAALARVELAAA